jgi:hypothetical protein
MIAIELPWPSADLSPNGGVSKWAKIKATKVAKNHGFWITDSLIGPLGIVKGSFIGPIDVQYTFYPALERGRDDDNFASRMKPYRDGIALALGVNDKHFRMQPVVFAPAVTGRPLKVVATITPSLVSIEHKGGIGE